MSATAMTLDTISGISIDFGGTKTAAARILNGQVVKHSLTNTQSARTAELQLRAISDQIQAMDPTLDDVIGVSVTGRIDDSGVWHAVNQDTLRGVSAVPLKQRLDEYFCRSCIVSNDVVAAATAELIVRNEDCSQNFAYITVSTGVGGICVLDGEVITSANGLAGHIGFMTSRLASERCGSGRTGTVESVASGNAIARAAALAGYPHLDAKAVFTEHLKGGAWATDIVDRSARAIAELGANLAVSVGVQTLLLGGSIGLASGYIDKVRQAMETEPALFRPTVEKARLQQNSVLIGALAVR